MFFVSVAHAMGAPAAGGQAGGNVWSSLVPLALMLVIFWFMLIRPQKKRAQEHKNLLANLKRGDYVITSGGMIGRIIELDEATVLLESGESKLRITRGAIGGLHQGDDKKGASALPTEEKKGG